MKKIIAIIFVISVFIACDKVKHPDQKPPAVKHCVDTSIMIVKTNATVNGFRKVLIEDYTGHYCGNCPRAAETATTIESAKKDSVVVIAVHSGSSFSPPVLPDYPEDFRTQTGTTDWDGFFGISGAGLPKGMINRGQTPFYQPKDNWSALVNQYLAQAQKAKLTLTTSFDPNSLYLNVNVKVKFLTGASYANDIRVSVVVTEDSIVATQKDYNPPAGVTVVNGDERPTYRFDNMLRGAVNSSWGEVIKAKPVVANDSASITYTCFKLDMVKNTKNVNVVAFVYDDGSKEVIQVEKIRIR